MRVRLDVVIIVELGLLVALMVLGSLNGTWAEGVAFPFALVLMFLVLHAPLLPFRGRRFVIHDEAPDSPLKWYWYLSIFLAAFGAGWMEKLVAGLWG